MSNEAVGLKNQEIDIIKRNSEGVIIQHKKIIFKNQVKTEVDMEV